MSSPLPWKNTSINLSLCWNLDFFGSKKKRSKWSDKVSEIKYLEKLIKILSNVSGSCTADKNAPKSALYSKFHKMFKNSSIFTKFYKLAKIPQISSTFLNFSPISPIFLNFPKLTKFLSNSTKIPQIL
jgi:hypothetical protein